MRYPFDELSERQLFGIHFPMLAHLLLREIADLSSSREQSPTAFSSFVYSALAQVLPFNDRTAVDRAVMFGRGEEEGRLAAELEIMGIGWVGANWRRLQTGKAQAEKTGELEYPRETAQPRPVLASGHPPRCGP